MKNQAEENNGQLKRPNQWYEETGWLVGANYTPCTAINQLEREREKMFDSETIDQELGWTEELGFYSRIFCERMALSTTVVKRNSLKNIRRNKKQDPIDE